jgi:hypothetical protein
MNLTINRGRDITITAGAALELGQRVKISSESNGMLTCAAAGAGELHVATMLQGCASGDPGPATLRGLGITLMLAAGAIAAGARVYGAAAGKVNDVPVGECLGVALTPSTADGDQIAVLESATQATGSLDTVEAHTAGDTLTALESGSVHTNTGAAGTITIVLPPATVGLEFEFGLGAAQQLRIDPDGTETISLPSTGVPGAAGKYLVADAIGETVHLKCVVAGNWAVMGYTGTWTAEA